MDPLKLACPRCHTLLQLETESLAVCPADQLQFSRVDGVWRCLLPERVSHFTQFIDDYRTVRAREGRGAADALYYESLPFVDVTGRFQADWRIRAASYRTFLKRVLEPFEVEAGQPLNILDVGAGNGWLSNRLALRGHSLATIDLQTNPSDGLGAHRYYKTSFLPVQAEYEHLPFAWGALDLIIYNASFHYAEDYARTLVEALQLLSPKGRIVILDTPFYQLAETGQQMVREREADFVRRFGFKSNALASESFLTPSRLAELASPLGLTWQQYRPWYGWRWHIRPWWARLRGRRPPAEFGVWVARRQPGLGASQQEY